MGGVIVSNVVGFGRSCCTFLFWAAGSEDEGVDVPAGDEVGDC